MELVVEDKRFRERLEEPGYLLLQRADSGVAYWNTRLIRRNVRARYYGVTHAYIDVPGGERRLEGAWYKDHTNASNRVGKFEGDIEFLSAALEQDPENRRYWFYLAQSYRDAGRTAEAAQAYAKRAEMGGFDEEAWNALLQEARCLRTLGDEGGFVRQALAAFNMRPQRAEPLYDLARFYREKGRHKEGYEIVKRAVATGAGPSGKAPDGLFVEPWIYEYGLLDEFAVNAYWAGAYQDCLDACERILRERRYPEADRPRIEANASVARQKLGLDPFVNYMDENFDKIQGAPGSKESVLFLTIMREWFSIYNNKGGACEIGVQYGKYLIALHNLLSPCSSLGIDVFHDQSKNIDRSGYGSIEESRNNIASFASNPESISLMSVDSLTIGPQDVEQILRQHGHFAIFSIDGGHTPLHASMDFITASHLTSPTGIIAVDDLFNPDWPGVTEGLYIALARRTSPFVPLYITRKKAFLCHASVQSKFASFVAERYSQKYSGDVRYVEFFGWRVPSLNFGTEY
jgi:tetratricopeptide (TPR) repeat protein